MQELLQEEVDTVVQDAKDAGSRKASEVADFDFGHLDRIPKSKVRAVHLLHENFVRNLSSSLSAYLRSYVALNLASLEQVSYSEFIEGLDSPTCIAYIGLQPYEGTAVLEMNTGLMFAFLELLLGSKGRAPSSVQRKITEIEKTLLQTLLRIILRDLGEAWKTVAEISLSVQSLASEPQLLQVLAPAEAVVLIAIEVHVGSTTGLMNLAIPSIFIKRLRHKFDDVRQVRRVESTGHDQAHMAQLLQDAYVTFEARIPGGAIRAQTLLNLEIGDVLVLDHDLGRPINGFVNGCDKWLGRIVSSQEKLAFRLKEASKTTMPNSDNA
ncbi:MAG: FliM/FliN family flagellar motor switch protein [Acidobacteriaceae bacterium]|nr:FliM/FliN family flagellar motor switch protein [Acidobacteriaceae bacterium]